MRDLAVAVIFAIVLSHASFAQKQACDYKIEILSDVNESEKGEFKWRMKASKIEGGPTNITGTAKVQAGARTVKSYRPWVSDPISKQKTSADYSLNLEPGDYKITAEIAVECGDINIGNNIATKEIKIKEENNENTLYLLPKTSLENFQQDRQKNETFSASAAPEIVYESSNEKAKNLIIVFLLALSILLNIVLIWRR